MEGLVRIGSAAQALGVSVDTLRRWEKDGRVEFERKGNQRFMRSTDLAALLRERTSETRSSARNHFAGVILDVKKDNVMAQVEMACGPYRVVSLMSSEAAEELGLKPGDSASAVIKSTNVVIEKR